MNAPGKVKFPSVVTRVSSTALILLSTAPLLEEKSALVDAWVEELASMVCASVTPVSRVRTVLFVLN